MTKSLGDRCYKCGKRATPLQPRTAERWHHCPRCGITFRLGNKTVQEIKDVLPGKHLAERYKRP